MTGDNFSFWLQVLPGGACNLIFGRNFYVSYMVFYTSIKYHDDPSFVRRLVVILVSDLW